MKRIFIYFLSFFLSQSILTHATDIVWSLSESPIIITEDFYLNESDRLIIEAGVEVRFLYYYKLHLNGQVIAKGTESQPIIFRANDTTGFYFPAVTNGGWKGITSLQNPGVGPDTFMYCHFRDLKMQNVSDNLSLAGNVYISNCEFYHCTSADDLYAAQCFLNINYFGDDSKMPILKDCKFYDIHMRHLLIFFKSRRGLIQNNIIYNNDYGHGLKVEGHSFFTDNSIEINGNEFYNNNSLFLSSGDNGPAITSQGVNNLKIINNKIYFNKSYGTTAMTVRKSYGVIENNFIANNECIMVPSHQYCVGSSGGLVIMTDGEDTFNTSTPTIYFRNNILSNNRTFNYGNLTLHYVNIEVTNNNFINNSSVISSPSVYVWGEGKTYKIKNNIFHNNISKFPVFANTEIRLANENSYEINANFFDKPLIHSFYNEDGLSILFTLLGDTLSNIFGDNPGFISVPVDTSTSLSVLSADFNLAETSPCIDAGQHSSIILSTVDYMNLERVNNGIVDIGAIEYITKNTKIEEVDGISFNIYPNPCKDYLKVGFPEIHSGQINIYSLQGKLLFTKKFHQEIRIQLDIQELSSGIYFLQLSSADHAQQTIQFVKVD